MVAAVARLTFAFCLFAAGSAFAGYTDVTTCGQVVVGKGRLVADLDCTGITQPAIEVDGRLDLGGFTLTGGGTNFAIHCVSHRCKIFGPGTITGPGGVGVLGRNRLLMKDVTLTDMAGGVSVSSTDGRGAATFQRCTFTDTGYGINAETRAKLIDTTITGTHRFGVMAAPAFSNDGSPCETRSLTLTRSSVSGATDDPYCATNICADLITCGKPPKLAKSTCGTSCRGGTGIPCTSWGICTND
jgi:hypothetical protein